MTRRPAQGVGQRRPGEDGVRRAQRAVDGRPGGVVRAGGQRRGRLEAPPAEASGDGRRLPSRLHARPQRRHGEHVRHHVVNGLDGVLVLVPRRRQEPHEARIVDGFDRRGAGDRRLVDREPGVAGQRGADRFGPARVLERRLQSRRLDLVLGVVGPVTVRGEHRDGTQSRSSCSSRYCSRHFERCNLPDDVFGSVPARTSITSRGGSPQTSSVRWWMSWRTASGSMPAGGRAPRPRRPRSPCPCSPPSRRR